MNEFNEHNDQEIEIDPAIVEAAMQAQQELVESCVEMMFEVLDSAHEEKVEDPVVYLIDCEDEIGRQIVSAWIGDEAVDNAIAQRKREQPEDERTTVFSQAFTLVESRREVPEVFPYLADAFDEGAPDDAFMVVAITAGGASVFTVPLSARDGN